MFNDSIRSIKKVAVIGAGTMGAAIAQHFLMKNLPVVLIDVQQAGLDKGIANIDASLQEAVERRILSPEKKAALMANLTSSTDYAFLADRELVVEAVFENLAVKQDVFRQIEQQVSPQCLIASNTSSFSITELGSVLEHQGRFLGVHYFYHAAKNKLIELIPGEKTTPDAMTLLTRFYFDKDKMPIVVADVYGFAVNRFFVPWLNEAVRLYEEGLGSIAFIDKVAVDVFNVGMGPFALMNATGVPITLHASRTLEEHFGSMYTPASRLIEIVETHQEWDLTDTNSPQDDLTAVTNRLLAMSLGVAAQMVSEGVTGITETDLGARLGLRWPIGPFELINQLGVNAIEGIIAEEFAQYNQPVPAVFQQVDREQGFIVEHVKAHVIGKTGLLEFNRPDAMNALNPEVIRSLDAAFEQLDSNPELDKIVLFGRGKAFVAGADIKFFIDNIKAGRLADIRQFAADGQAVLNKIATSKKQTIAFLDGLTLGGGLELALACQYRVASRRFAAAFPETGIGIYPGLGGTQRSSRLLGKALAKFLVATGAMLNAEQALAYGLVSDIVDSSNNLDQIAAMTAEPPQPSLTGDIPEQVFANFDGDINSPLLQDQAFQPFVKDLARKAPLALRKAISLIDEGYGLPLDQALQLELDGLEKAFATEDALVGLSSITTGKTAQYTGK